MPLSAPAVVTFFARGLELVFSREVFGKQIHVQQHERICICESVCTRLFMHTNVRAKECWRVCMLSVHMRARGHV